MPNPLYTYILNIYDLVWLDFIAYCRLFNTKSYLCIYIKYIDLQTHFVDNIFK